MLPQTSSNYTLTMQSFTSYLYFRLSFPPCPVPFSFDLFVSVTVRVLFIAGDTRKYYLVTLADRPIIGKYSDDSTTNQTLPLAVSSLWKKIHPEKKKYPPCLAPKTVFSLNSIPLAKFLLKTREDQSKLTPSGPTGLFSIKKASYSIWTAVL